MDYQEEIRHQKFDAEKKYREQIRATKRLALISILLIILGAMIVLGGCASFQELEAQYENCQPRKSEACVKLQDKLIAMEDRRVEKKFVKEYYENFGKQCARVGLIGYCRNAPPKTYQDLRSCGCISRDVLRDLMP